MNRTFFASFAFLAALLCGESAHATTCGAVPFTLVNGQIADANQVMANFGALQTCANNVLVMATINNPTINGATITGTTILPGGGQISSAGLLGIGMSPVTVLDITQNQNGASIAEILNNSAGTAASAVVEVKNGTSTGIFEQFGSAFTTSGINRQNGTLLSGSGAGGLTLNTSAAQPIYFAVNGTQVGSFTAAGTFTVTNLAAASGTPVCINATALASCTGSFGGDVVGPGSATDGHLAVFDGSSGKLIKDGGAPPTNPGTWTWSSGTTLATGYNSFTHNLGVNFKAQVRGVIVCTSTDAGYAVGDSIELLHGTPDNNQDMATIGTEASGNVSFVNINQGINAANKGTQANTALTLAKWTLYIGVLPNF
jgi:hypothetical protein